jgi:hypothetical protein
MKKSNWKTFLLFGILTGLMAGCASAALPSSAPAPTATVQPMITPAPTLTQSPTPSPHSLVVIKATLSDDLLGVLIQNTDSDGEPLDTMGLGFLCLSQGIYAVDESGSRLRCVQVTDATDTPNQIAIIFSGAAPGHTYQLVRGEDAPIDLLPENAEADNAPASVSGQVAHIKAGRWEGNNPSVSFNVLQDGSIADFSIVVSLFGNDCTLEVKSIVLDSNGAFVLTSEYDGEQKRTTTITGKFENETRISGTADVQFCSMTNGSILVLDVFPPVTQWAAEWISSMP